VVIPKDGGIGRVGLLRATGFLRATGLGGAGFLLATGFGGVGFLLATEVGFLLTTGLGGVGFLLATGVGFLRTTGLGGVGFLLATGLSGVGRLRTTGLGGATLGGAGFLLATGFLRVVGFFCAPLARLIISCISSGDGPREEERGVVLRTDLVAGRTRRRVDRLPTGVFLVLLPTLLDLPPMTNTYQKDFVRNCSAS